MRACSCWDLDGAAQFQPYFFRTSSLYFSGVFYVFKLMWRNVGFKRSPTSQSKSLLGVALHNVVLPLLLSSLERRSVHFPSLQGVTINK